MAMGSESISPERNRQMRKGGTGALASAAVCRFAAGPWSILGNGNTMRIIRCQFSHAILRVAAPAGSRAAASLVSMSALTVPRRPQRKAHWVTWFSILVAVLSLPACAGPSNDGGSDGSQPQVIGSAPIAVGRTPSVVMLEALEGGSAERDRDTILMDQIDIAFTPALLLVQRGQVVEFRNSEAVPHNVRARDRATNSALFNVETGSGESYYHAFQGPGEYSIVCDIHPGMSATVLVVTTPYVTMAASDGSFAFTAVPEGAYTLRVWSADETRRLEQRITIDGTLGQVILE